METIELNVNGHEVSFRRLNAFDTHKLVQQLVKTLGPVMTNVKGTDDVSKLLANLADTEDVIETIALPVFAKCNLVVDGKQVKTVQDINAVFTAETILDLYEITFAVIKEQVGDFFGKLMTRFGAAI